VTQEDQDKVDEEHEREAMQNLVQTWLERLQLISVIVSRAMFYQAPQKILSSYLQTTFFASTESGLLGKSLPSPGDVLTTAGQVANVCFMCALLVHAHAGRFLYHFHLAIRQLISFAAVISFLGAFLLVRYKLEVAEHDEEEVEQEMVDSEKSISSDPFGSSASGLRANKARGRVRVKSDSPNHIIYSTNPRLVQVGPFHRNPPTELLSRCHSLCVFLTFLGFLFAITGLISFSWNQLPTSIGIAASVSMGFCIITGASILVYPFTNTSHRSR
jgi:hypothetical protein